jgi:radical SAM superfamily enzyme YgiQ (UPF0313 family)
MSTWRRREEARDLMSREIGVVRKPHADRLRIALLFPNTYFVGMSNLGLQSVYRLFNDHADVVCERAFLPPREEVKADQWPPGSLITIESQTPVGEFDVIAFSVSFEWDYTNVLTMLRLAGLPLYASERQAGHPLVVAGGAATSVNPEPIAPFVDVVAIGDGEVLVPELVRHLTAASGRGDLLRSLSGERGFYVPSFYEVRYRTDGTIEAYVPVGGGNAAVPVRKATLRATRGVDPPSTCVFTPETEFGSRLLVEIVRGCANLCRFCWAGYNYLPVRPFPAERILALAEAARPHADRIGLVSIAVCDHPEIDRLLARFHEMRYRISPASLRLDDLTDSVVRTLRASGERSITIAPETGSDHLRRVINKSITNEEILGKVDLIAAAGIENVKLYFMIGLPLEEDEDLVAIRDLTVAIRDRMLIQGKRRKAMGRITASVNPLVPKPGTPYQWIPMEAPRVLEEKTRRLRSLTARIPNVIFSIKPERHAFYQALLSRGDRRMAPALVEAERNGGHWRQAVDEIGIDPDFYVLRERRVDEVLPWDIVDRGMKPGFFHSEYQKSMHADCTLPQKVRGVDGSPGPVAAEFPE